jgi:hypothetical protein
VFVSLVIAGALLVVAAGVLLSSALRLRGEVKRAGWVLTRVGAAIGEAERAGRVRAELADS